MEGGGTSRSGLSGSARRRSILGGRTLREHLGLSEGIESGAHLLVLLEKHPIPEGETTQNSHDLGLELDSGPRCEPRELGLVEGDLLFEEEGPESVHE